MGLRSRYGLIGIDTGRESIPLSGRQSSRLVHNSKDYGIVTLPEAKIGPVKRMPKRGMDSCRLHAPNSIFSSNH
jgi:hypothetical protein